MKMAIQNRDRKSDLGTLTIEVSQVVPVLRHNKEITSKYEKGILG